MKIFVRGAESKTRKWRRVLVNVSSCLLTSCPIPKRHLHIRKSGVLGSIPGLATYFRFSFRFFKKGSCQLLAKVCARSTG